MGFRGDGFELISGRALGDGQDDTRPMNTWLANRLWGNTMWLAGEPHTACWSPAIASATATTAAGSKPYTILSEWGTVWAGPMYIHPGQTSLNVYPVGVIESPGTGTKNIRIRVTVEGLGDAEGTYSRTETGGAVLTFGRDKITVTFDEIFIAQAPELRFVRIEMRAVEKVAPYVQTTATSLPIMAEVSDSAATAFFVNSTSGNPDTDSMETMSLRWNLPGRSDQEFDIIGVSGDISGKGGGVGTSTAFLARASALAVEYDFDVYLDHLTYWSPRVIVFEPGMDLESAGRIASAALEPNLPVDYGPAMMQVDAIHQLHRRPRIVGMGPRGVVDDSETMFVGYRICWPYVMGDDAETIIIDDSIEITTENPIIEVEGWCVVVQHDTHSNFDSSSRGSKRKQEGSDALGQVAWDISASLLQMADAAGTATWAADATSFGSYTETETFDLYPTNLAYSLTPEPIARGLEHMYQGTVPGAVTAGLQQFWFKEGMLLDGDRAYLQPFRVRIETSGMTHTEAEKPFRLKVTAQHNTAADNDYLKILNSGSEDSVRFVLGHYTISEIPQNGKGTLAALAKKKTIPTDLVLPSASDHQPKGYIKASAWQPIMESLHYLWQRSGALIGGMSWDSAWSTSSTSYTGTNNTGDLNLSAWAGACVLKRPNPDGTYSLRFDAYMANLDLQFAVYRFNDRTTLALLDTVTLSNATTDSAWVTGSLEIAALDAMEGGSGSTPAVFYIAALAKTSSGVGLLWKFAAREEWHTPPNVGLLSGSAGFTIAGGSADIVDGAPSGKAPDELSTAPYMWFDANDGATVISDVSTSATAGNGDAVQKLTDKSGNARHVQNASAASTDIVYSVTGFNGMPSVDFLDTAQGFLETTATHAGLGSNDFTIVWVGQYTGVTGEHSYLLSKQNVNLHVYAAPERFGGDGLGWFNGSHNGFGGSTVSAEDIWVWDLDASGNYKGYQQSTQIGSTVTGISFSTSADELRVGSPSVNDFKVAELIVYDSQLSGADLADLITHLKAKWGL